MNARPEIVGDVVQIRRAKNRRIGVILAILAGAVFISVIFRQWVTGGA